MYLQKQPLKSRLRCPQTDGRKFKMNINLTLMIGVCALCAAVFIIRRSFKKDVISLLLKTLASICFVILGFCSALWAENFDRAGILIIGLIFGMLGDIFLDLKYVDLPNTTAYTAAGFAAFIFGHVFFITFILDHNPEIAQGKLISLIAGIAGGILIYATPKLMKLNYGPFRVISAVYGAILVFITVYAGFKAFQNTTYFTLLFFIGLVCFLLSDLVLSQIYFGENRDTPAMSAVNHSLYYIAQIMIAASIYYA